MMQPFKQHSFQYHWAIKAGLAVLIAVLFNHYAGFADSAWMLLTAYIVGQTTKGTPFRQGMLRFLVIVAAIVLSSMFIASIKQPAVVEVLTAILFVVAAQTLFIYRQLQRNAATMLLVFLIIALINLFAPQTAAFVYDRLMDVVIGAVIGMLCTQFIFPVRQDREFRLGVLTIIKSLIHYSERLQAKIMTPAVQTHGELALLWQEKDSYPEWVYEVGFNPGLRSGFRFFLINLDRVTEIYLSIDYLTHKIDAQMLQALTVSMNPVMANSQILLQVLQEYFINNKLLTTESDFTSDMVDLEKTLNNVVPTSLELLDVSQDNLYATAIVRDLKDLRGILLQLVMALPSTQLVPVKKA